MDHNNDTPPEMGREKKVSEGLSSPLASHDAHLSWTDFNNASDQLDLDDYTPEDLKRIADGLGKATQSGNGYSCLCPAHNDHHPSCSLSLGTGGKFLAYCHAGCPSWDVVMRIHELGLLVKINGTSAPVPLPLLAAQGEEIRIDKGEQDRKKEAKIKKTWEESVCAARTPVETYLRIRIPSLSAIPDALHFHPKLWHDETQSQYRAMIAKVTFEGQPDHYVIHRTFLKDDGSGKAKIKPDKKSWGSVKGGSIQLYKAEDILGVGEGIETCLSVRVLFGVSVWAGISAGNMEGLVLPPLPLAQKLVIFIDNDGNNTGLNSARKLEQRAKREGREVYIVRPPLAFNDFNDTFNAYWGKDFDARTLIESVDGKNIDFLFGIQNQSKEDIEEGAIPSIFEDDSPEIPEEAYDAALEEMWSDIEKPNLLVESELALQKESLDPWERTLDLLHNSRKNLFITGAAGTGKSTLLQKFRAESKKNILVVAPTGVAALNVDGQTIHKAFNFSVPMSLKKVRKLSEKERQFYKKIDILVIDEVSMVRADLLDCVDQFLRKNAHSPDRPFGGVRLVMMGDPYQLSPVISKDEERQYLQNSGYETPYFFSAKCYKNIELIELTKIHRQKDEAFITVLNKIRHNKATKEDLEIFAPCFKPNGKAGEGEQPYHELRTFV